MFCGSQHGTISSSVNGIRCISVNIQDGKLNKISRGNISRTKYDKTKLLNSFLKGIGNETFYCLGGKIFPYEIYLPVTVSSYILFNSGDIFDQK